MTIKQHYVVYPNVTVEPSVSIGEFSVIGKPTRLLVGQSHSEAPHLSTFLGRDSVCGTHVLIESGAYIGRNCIVESQAVIETGVTIGDGSFVVHGARICGHATVGKSCVIGGFVAERSRIGNHCRVLGMLIHRQLEPSVAWDEYVEQGPTLEDHVFVAMASAVVGEVRLCNHVYVAAGAIVTKDVPSYHVVHGVNCLVPVHEWRGPLSGSQFWR
jgi:UDP-3-O-[3-hydroxymyristoyl] glucosamine N-acyltransferase